MQLLELCIQLLASYSKQLRVLVRLATASRGACERVAGCINPGPTVRASRTYHDSTHTRQACATAHYCTSHLSFEKPIGQATWWPLLVIVGANKDATRTTKGSHNIYYPETSITKKRKA